MKKQYYVLLFLTLFATFICSNFDVNANKVDKSEVIFTFDGLQVLAFGNPDKVSDGILDVSHHTPKLEIKQIDRNRKEKLIATYQGKDLYKKVLNITLPNNSLNLNNPTNSLKPTRYYSYDMNKDKQDFRWCLDLESDLFQKQLYLKEDRLFAKIHFNVGTFFSASVTDEKYKFTSGSKIHSFNRELGTPGASVELQSNDRLVISGLDKQISLPYQMGVSYKVDITNLPPKDMASIDHFGFYYDVMRERVDRFMPVMVQKSGYFPRPLACEAVILGKSTVK
jgi:hypothetical protein